LCVCVSIYFIYAQNQTQRETYETIETYLMQSVWMRNGVL